MSDITINKPVSEMILAALDGIQTARMNAISDFVDIACRLREKGIDAALVAPIHIDEGEISVSGNMEVKRESGGSLGLAFSALTGEAKIKKDSVQAIHVACVFKWRVDPNSPVLSLTPEQVEALK